MIRLLLAASVLVGGLLVTVPVQAQYAYYPPVAVAPVYYGMPRRVTSYYGPTLGYTAPAYAYSPTMAYMPQSVGVTSYYAPTSPYYGGTQSSYYAPTSPYYGGVQTSYYAPNYSAPLPVTTYYSPSPVVAAPVVAAPVVVGPTAVVRSKVYYPYQPVRNTFRAITP
ncbi:MAG: hypothetical protein QM811_28740 [Pirellulales bacterium]